MQGARSIALAATVGNLLQGWDNGAIAGALLYLKPEFGLVDSPALEGIVVASTLVGAWISTLFAGPGADSIGRRWMLCVSGIIFSISACIMLWSPNVYVLLVSRLLVGTAIGLAVTIIPMYIAESSPPEIRGQLSTLPQLMGSGGLFLVYIMVFILSLTNQPNWRLMLGCLLVPAIIFLNLTIFYLPESPRWLVSKGRMSEAKKVLQRLRNKTDVAAELALLVEGLEVGANTSIEEWLLQPVEPVEEDKPHNDENQVKIYDSIEGISSWVAKTLTDETNNEGTLTRRDTAESLKMPFVDSVVTLFGSFRNAQEHLSEHYSNFAHEQWDEDSHQRTPLAHDSQFEDIDEMGETLTTHLLSRPTSDKQDVEVPHYPRSNSQSTPHHEVHGRNVSLHDFFGNSYSRHSFKRSDQDASLRNNSSDVISDSMPNVGIGNGWQLAWRWVGPEGHEGNGEVGSLNRVFLKQEVSEHAPPSMSALSLPGVGGGLEQESIPAAVLVGQRAQSMKDLLHETPVGPAMVHPAETATKGPVWSDLLEGGVRRALMVGIGLQILQQFSGINAVLYFVPQILQQSGATVILEKVGVGENSGSILASGFTCLMMLPCIVLAMKLMDQSGRRQLLLATLPLLVFSLVALVLTNLFLPAGLLQAAASFIGVAIYICTFVMGFGPIPNILCAEIFPTRIRGVCMAICQAIFWLCNLIVTNAFPVLLLGVGIGGVFSIFAAVSLLAWIFVFLKVPETKGMPLEVISEFFAMSASDKHKPEPTDISV